jgi:hypothetical protein
VIGDIFDVRITFIVILIMSFGDYPPSHAVTNKSCNPQTVLIHKIKGMLVNLRFLPNRLQIHTGRLVSLGLLVACEEK